MYCKIKLQLEYTMRNLYMKKVIIGIVCFLVLAAVGGSVWAAVTINKAKETYRFAQQQYELCPEEVIAAKLMTQPDKEVSYSTDNNSVCVVDDNGSITAAAPGQAIVMAKIGMVKVSCTINVREHSFSAATCTEDSSCIYCGKPGTDKAFGHNPSRATCTEDGVCQVCGLSMEKALGHDFSEATCTEPEICSRCHAPGEPALGHDFTEATCELDSVCRRCGEAGEQKALGHIYSEATCTQAATCERCGSTEGEPLGHTEGSVKCGKPVVCTVCGETIREAAEHDYKDATCTKPRTCKVCGAKDGKALGHDAEPATCTTASVCKRCNKTVAGTTAHLYVESGGAKVCAYCGATQTITPSAGSGSGSVSASAYATRVVELVNAQRAAYGLSALAMDGALMTAAQIRSDECITYYGHTRPDGSSCFTVLDQCGVSYRGAGENIAAGYVTPEDVVNGWMNSPSHRENILDPEFTRIGVGYSYSAGTEYGSYWSQCFAI